MAADDRLAGTLAALARGLPGTADPPDLPALAARVRRALVRRVFLVLCGRQSRPVPPDLPPDPLSRVPTTAVPADLADDLDGLYQRALGYELHRDEGGRLAVRRGRAGRKRAGAFSTPPALVECLLRHAAGPLLAPPRDPERLRVCDPACGGGRFLVAAGRRLAARLPDGRAAELYGRCLHGTDTDPCAVDVCRYQLWLEVGRGGLRLADVAANVRAGDSLLGGDRPPAGSFDLVLCNPPWERVKFQKAEGGSPRPRVARARAAAAGASLRASGRYPLGARGDLNYYGPFVEECRRLVTPGGRVGMVVPGGLATDVSMAPLFASLVGNDLIAWYDFHNGAGLFPAVQGNVKFGLLVLGRRDGDTFEAAGGLARPADLGRPGRVYRLSGADLRQLNPNTGHCPAFTSAARAALVRRLHDRFPVLARDDPPENPWGVRLGTMFHMTKDAGLFRTLGQVSHSGHGATYLPLLEAKLVHQYNHRAATFDGIPAAVRFRTHARTRRLSEDELGRGLGPVPRYWVEEAAVAARAGRRSWFLGFRNAISTAADSRSLVAAVLPRCAVGNSLPLVGGLDARRACLLLGILNSFLLDFVLREKASGNNLNFHVLKQLPVPLPEGDTADAIAARALELTCTTENLTPFARECGRDGPPFAWHPERRRRLRAELDVLVFRLYGLSRAEAADVLDTFPVLARQETGRYGLFRSRDDVLAAWDAVTAGPARRGGPA